MFIRSSVDTAQPLLTVSNDGVLLECDNLILRYFGHDMVGASTPNNGRVNLLYQDQGYTRIDKRGTIGFCAFRSYNCKGDTFPATEKASSLAATGAWLASSSYFKGAIVWDTPGKSVATSRFYQAIVDIKPAQLVPLSDPASWYPVGLVFNKAYGAQPLRQGNAALRYHVGCHGNVACVTYNAQLPNPNSGYGIALAPDEAVNADFSTFYRDPINNDYRPKNVRNGDMVNSPLLDRVPAGKAILPFDLAGQPRMNDGSGAAGAYERISF